MTTDTHGTDPAPTADELEAQRLGAADVRAGQNARNTKGAADEGAADEGAADEGAADEGAADEGAADEGDTFPRAYVEQLRGEARRARQQRAEDRETIAALSADLWRARVEATGRLADPSDLPHDPDTEQTPEAVAEAIDALLQRKPHLAARRVSGDIGLGNRATPEASLAGMLRSGA